MTTAADIIQQAYREGNLLGVGKDPTAAEETEALSRLNILLLGSIGADFGEFMQDWPVPQPQRTAAVAANYPQLPLANDLPPDVANYPPKNTRIVWNGTTQTVWFPEAPQRGSRMSLTQPTGLWNGDPDVPLVYITLDGNGFSIDGETTQQYDNTGHNLQWFFKPGNGLWQLITSVALTDEWPFPSDMTDYWVLMLAFRLASRYGKTMGKESLEALKLARSAVRRRYSQTQDVTFGGENTRPTSQAFNNRGGWM